MTTPTQLPRFIAASGLTNLADGVAMVVWAWIASLLTRDPILIAMMPVALRLPWFLFALPAGIVTDRMDRRRLILAMDITRGCAFVVAAVAVAMASPLPEATEAGMSSPVLFSILAIAALAVGTAEVFRDNAAQTILPALVPPDELERANGRLWSVEIIGQFLLGPTLGAFLIAAILWLPFALNAAAFLVAASIIATLRVAPQPTRTQPKNWGKELREGLAFLRDAPLLRLLAIITGVWNLFDQMVVIALVLYVQEVLGLGAPGFGMILAASAFGGIAAGFAAEHIIRRLGPGRTAQWALGASALSFALVPLAPTPMALALVLAAFEFIGLTWNTVSVSYRQRVIPSELLGRVNSVYRLFAWGMMPIGLALSGVIVSVAEGPLDRATALTAPFWVAAAGTILLTLLAWRALGRGFQTTR